MAMSSKMPSVMRIPTLPHAIPVTVGTVETLSVISGRSTNMRIASSSVGSVLFSKCPHEHT